MYAAAFFVCLFLFYVYLFHLSPFNVILTFNVPLLVAVSTCTFAKGE